MIAGQASDGRWTPPSSVIEYQSLRDRFASSDFRSALTAQLEGQRRLALERRAHRGEIDFLQGCDIANADTLDQGLKAQLFNETRDQDALTAALAAIEEALVQRYADLPLLPAGQAEPLDALAQIAARDQLARQSGAASITDPLVREWVEQAFMSQNCRIDLENAHWLAVNLDRLMPVLDSQEPLEQLYLIAMHADGEPALQQRVAFFLGRLSAARLISFEKAARLSDRARVNQGLPQIYGTGVICVDGQGVIVGGGRSETFALNRSAVGLSDFDAYLAQVQSSCGGGPR